MYAHAGAEALAVTGTPEAQAVAAGQLIRQATSGDLDAFEELVHRLQRRVYGFAYQHLRDLDEAYDLTQEIFVKLYRNLARYDAERPFEPWFWKLAANTTINYRRKRVPLPTDQAADQRIAGPAPRSRPRRRAGPARPGLSPAYPSPLLRGPPAPTGRSESEPHHPGDQVAPPPSSRVASQLVGGIRGGRPVTALACARVRVLLEAYVDGDLALSDPASAQAVREHLLSCADCRRQHEQAVSLPFRMKALGSPTPPTSLIAGVMASIAPLPQRSRRAWSLLIPEALLGSFILWYLSGLEGLTAIASGAWSDLQSLAIWGSGSAPLPSIPVADALLLGAFIALTAIAAYHLSVLSRLDPASTPRLRESRRA